jgi:hypothetical protein
MMLIILCKMLFLTKTFPGFCNSKVSIFVLKCFYGVLKLKVSLNTAQVLLQLIYVAKIFLVSFLCE